MAPVDTRSDIGFDRRPGFPMSFKPADKRVTITFAGTVIVDSTKAMVMDEDAHQPVYYFPQDEVRMDLMSRTDHSSR